jgi:transcription initiation factor IIE alpha subunit
MPIDALIDALVWSADEHELAEHFHIDVATVRDRLTYLTDADTARINAELDRREARMP